MSVTYKLTISGFSNLQQGAFKSAISNKKSNKKPSKISSKASINTIDLTFYENDKIIKRANLAPDRSSLNRTLDTTKDKINLICKRLGIDEQQLDYDRSDLSSIHKLSFKIRFLKKMLFEAFVPTQWVIVYKKKGQNKWKKIIPDSKVFQADTFIVFKDDTYYLFYEELKFEDYHGYLMVAELDIDNNRLINEKVILKLDHHLSFPNVFEEQGSFYMIPECADGNSVDLYECTTFPYQWQKKKTLIANTSAVDTTPLKTKDGWYLFTSIIEKGAGCNDELSIYKSSDIFNQPFVKLYDEPVISDVKNARMGGHFLHRDGEVFRVSQNCGKRYGHQANFNKVLQIENGYKEELSETIKPNIGALGFHTYNQDHDLIVGDMEIARFDWYSLKRFVWGNIKKQLFGR